jgi:RNA polymerase sigma factor (sigma-70 family)
VAAARVADLFERHGRMVYGICRTMLRDAHEAEDATQQAFLSAHRALLGGARVRDPGAWIATIARNECRGRISEAMRTALPVPHEELLDVPDPIDAVERQSHAAELCDALAQLPERQREAVTLRYLYGLRYGEVATALGLSRPATEALLFRARRTMRIRLRHATAAALVVPVSIRDELALALPGFDAQTGGSAATAGLTGGLLAKLLSAPAGAKVTAATVAISTIGAVGVVESDRPVTDAQAEARPGFVTPSERPGVASALSARLPASAGKTGNPSVSAGGKGQSRADVSGRAGVGGVADETRDPRPAESVAGAGGAGSEHGDSKPEVESDPESESSGEEGSASSDDDSVDVRGSDSMVGTSERSGPSLPESLDEEDPEEPDEQEELDERSSDSGSGSGSNSGPGSGSDAEPDDD